jgi:hypothetical protein
MIYAPDEFRGIRLCPENMIEGTYGTEWAFDLYAGTEGRRERGIRVFHIGQYREKAPIA